MGALDGKVALITGAARGQGAAEARLFVERGAKVMMTDVLDEEGQQVAAEIGDSAAYMRLDVTSEDGWKEVVAATVEKFGKLNVLVNNAGIITPAIEVHETTLESYRKVIEVNQIGVFLGMKHCIPVMKKQGGGSIINTASVAALVCGHTPHLYSVGKAAVVHLSKSVALEVGEDNIRVNAICPGFIVTPLSTNTVGRDDQTPTIDYKIKQPIPRVGQPDDIAQMACWLAGERSTFVTGQTIAVDGGTTAGVPWNKQPGYQKSYHPIKVYRPESAD